MDKTFLECTKNRQAQIDSQSKTFNRDDIRLTKNKERVWDEFRMNNSQIVSEQIFNHLTENDNILEVSSFCYICQIIIYILCGTSTYIFT